MTAVEVASPAALAQETPRRFWTRGRLLLLFFATLAVVCPVFGIPLDRTEIVLGCVILSLILTWGSDRQDAWGTVRDFGALALLLAAYDRGRGAADGVFTAHTRLPIEIDKAIGFGHVPTLALQHHLLDAHAHRWEVVLSVVYLSHFFVPLVVCVLVRARAPHLWRAWLRRFLTLTAVVLVCYVLVPWTPPWLAAKQHAMAPVLKSVTRGLRSVGLHFAGDWVDQGAAASNQVASMPSLHSAYPVLVLLFFWPLARRTWQRVVLVAYPVAMGFTLVVTGEHWVCDVLAAWLLVAVLEVGFRRWDRSTGSADFDAVALPGDLSDQRAVHPQRRRR